jgi:hypothetical protein
MVAPHRSITPDLLASTPAHPLYALESACVMIVWQREFQLQEVKGLRFEVLGGKLSYEFYSVRSGKTRYLSTKQST